jgi:hypothetical protein
MEVMLTEALRIAQKAKRNANRGCRDRRSEALKESVLTTWRAILRIVHRRMRAGACRPGPDGLVRLQMTNQMVAAAAGVSGRTVIRHRAKLAAAGLIEASTFRGSHAPYEIAIHGRNLGIGEAIDPAALQAELDALCARAEALEAYAGGDRLSPHHEASSSPSIEENRGCGKEAPPDGSGAPPAGGREGSIDATQIGRKHGRQDGSARDGGSRHRQEEIRPARADLAESLWALARVLLWPDRPHSPRQVADARRHIAAIYAQVPDGQLQQWHENFCGMVAAARRYIDGDPLKRFVVSADMWFSPGFKHGFRATWPWHLAWERQRRVRLADAAVDKAVRAWKRNEIAPPSRRSDPLELYRRLTHAIADFGVEAATQRWLCWISNFNPTQ